MRRVGTGAYADANARSDSYRYACANGISGANANRGRPRR